MAIPRLAVENLVMNQWREIFDLQSLLTFHLFPSKVFDLCVSSSDMFKKGEKNKKNKKEATHTVNFFKAS